MPSEPNSNTLNNAWHNAPNMAPVRPILEPTSYTQKQVAHIIDRREGQHPFKIALGQRQQCSAEHRSQGQGEPQGLVAIESPRDRQAQIRPVQ